MRFLTPSACASKTCRLKPRKFFSPWKMRKYRVGDMRIFSCASLRYGLGLLALSCAAGCLTETLERQAEQIRQQNEEIAKQRQELEGLAAGKQLQDRQQQDCARAFRDYFDKAQSSNDRELTVALYRDGLM